MTRIIIIFALKVLIFNGGWTPKSFCVCHCARAENSIAPNSKYSKSTIWKLSGIDAGMLRGVCCMTSRICVQNFKALAALVFSRNFETWKVPNCVFYSSPVRGRCGFVLKSNRQVVYVDYTWQVSWKSADGKWVNHRGHYRMTDRLTESQTDTSTDNKRCLKLAERMPKIRSEIWVDPSLRNLAAKKHQSFGSISHNFATWSRISPERKKTTSVRKRHCKLRTLPHRQT